MEGDNNIISAELPEWMSRTEQLIGEENCRKLRSAHVLVAGIGGVGAMAAENLVRSGIGTITILDTDTVQPSNINRQVPALHSTLGRKKVEVMKERLLDINPGLEINTLDLYLNDDTFDDVFSCSYDFVVDAIDTLSPKINLIEKVYKRGIPLTSSMGSGGKTDPTKVSITDFAKTYNCPLAYTLRKKLRKMGVMKGFKVVFSTELIDKKKVRVVDNERNKKSIIGTVPFIPAIFGCMLASIVVNSLIGSE